MNNYILNRETEKIELHFDKADYLALSDTQKKDLKSAYLWSNYGKCWVSRSKIPNTHHAERVAEKLGFSGLEKVGTRLSYAEQLERKAERAEARAERYEEYANNAQRRAETLQKPLNNMRGDIAFFTQPIISGHSGSQAFARCRERMYAKYERGMDEYRKSAYFEDRAATARTTATNAKLKDAIYLDNRIKECNKNLRDYQKLIVSAEDKLYRLQQGETLTNYNGEAITAQAIEIRLDDIIERYEVWQDKLDFFESCMMNIGGVQFSQNNIKVGYIVEVARWGKCEIVGAGPVNITYKILDGGAAGGVLTDAYAAIVKIIAERETPKIENPYRQGDILCKHRPSDDSIYQAYQVIKTTKTGVKIQKIAVENGLPIADRFISDKAMQKKITKSKFSDFVGVYVDDWQLHKYNTTT